MHTIPAGLIAFDAAGPIPNCGRWKDTMPKTRDPAAYRLYIEARKFWRSKVEWQFTRQEISSILHDVQTASDQGDWGARALMATFYRSGLGPLESNHVLEADGDKMVAIVRTAVAAGQAWGYYDLGVAHEHGFGDAVQDARIAWAYYRKAAELGSPDAQMVLADAYLNIHRMDAEEAMRQCAFRQGHGAAAEALGIRAQGFENFAEAVSFYQAGARFGHAGAAFAISLLFDPENWYRFKKKDQDVLENLHILPDIERMNRYRQISDALELNPDLRLSRLDTVLPLPPTPLQAWRNYEDALEPEQDAPPTY